MSPRPTPTSTPTGDVQMETFNLKRVCFNYKCNNHIPDNAHLNKKYCSRRCANSQSQKNWREKQKAKERAKENVDRIANWDGSEKYEQFVEDGWPEQLLEKRVSMYHIAEEVGVSVAAVSRWFDIWKAKRLLEEEAGQWEPPAPYSLDPVEDFCQMREECFQTEKGEPYTTPEHQRRWIKATLDTWAAGGCLVILSPPRHGKTELLIHFCVWLTVRYPNIRILYIGGSQEIAEYSVLSVKDHLELNENLRQFIKPGKKFKPGVRSGKSWTAQRFTVATREIVGMKGPTMKAVGRGGRILSLDADLIIVDDPEDHDSTVQPGMRSDTRGWWAKSVMSRKMEHTGVVVIGSRCHPDDLVGHLVSSPEFDAIVEQVHDDAVCTADPESIEGHVDCMLWPEMRSYKWALAKKRDPLEGEFYEMVYLNRAVDSELATFHPEDIDACMDPARSVGHIPKNTQLIAGLDPAVSGYQAAFLWAVDTKTGRRYMVDLDNHLGGGIEPALDIMVKWYNLYRCSHWVIEENLYHGAIIKDDKITKWARDNYVTLEGHETWGTNKWDRYMGVTSMARYFTDTVEIEESGRRIDKRIISLPAADHESRAKSGEYRKQLLNFNRDVAAKMGVGSRSKKNKSDIVMAAWFPESVIRRWSQQTNGVVNYTYTPTSYPFTRMELTGVGHS